MDCTAYKQQVCAKTVEAAVVQYTPVEPIDGWEPSVACCHENVDHWVKCHPGSAAVRGWVGYMPYGNGHWSFTAHSVVRDSDGKLIDITPAAIPDSFRGPFVVHDGDDETFFQMVQLRQDIRCENGRCAPEITWDLFSMMGPVGDETNDPAYSDIAGDLMSVYPMAGDEQSQ